jgi:hypothetical protein
MQRFWPVPLQPRGGGEPPNRGQGCGQNDRRFAFEAFGQLVERAFVVPRVGHKPPALDDQFIEAAAAK